MAGNRAYPRESLILSWLVEKKKKKFDFVGGIFSAANRENMPPRFPRDSPATIRQPTVHVPCTRPDCVLPGCINLKLQTMNNETRKTKMHGSGPKSR